LLGERRGRNEGAGEGGNGRPGDSQHLRVSYGVAAASFSVLAKRGRVRRLGYLLSGLEENGASAFHKKTPHALSDP